MKNLMLVNLIIVLLLTYKTHQKRRCQKGYKYSKSRKRCIRKSKYRSKNRYRRRSRKCYTERCNYGYYLNSKCKCKPATRCPYKKRCRRRYILSPSCQCVHKYTCQINKCKDNFQIKYSSCKCKRMSSRSDKQYRNELGSNFSGLDQGSKGNRESSLGKIGYDKVDSNYYLRAFKKFLRKRKFKY